MRIVAGKYRSRTIQTLEGDPTRPTSTRIKEAIFSSIGPYFEGGAFLDAYAGSGNIGIEAISRGIDHVDAFEINPKAVKIIKQNYATLGIEKQLTLYSEPIEHKIELLRNQKYTCIYLDPPYLQQQNHLLINKISELDLLSEDGVIVVESKKQDCLDEHIGNYCCTKVKTYGISKISYYRKETK